MAKKKILSQFNTSDLSRMIKELGKKHRIFHSEAQFQFELGWKIKQQFHCNVQFEYPNIVNSCKEYTDIVLESNSRRIAIELKYKTTVFQSSLNNIMLLHHGAVDLGCYDYMHDINRLEYITNPNNSTNGLNICDTGYAIILTNDKKYWSASNPTTIYRDFYISGNPNGQLRKGCHVWWSKNVRGAIPKTALAKHQSPITLQKDYLYKWEDYCKPFIGNNGTFKFMIVEV